jgi:CBS domain-containing protein
MGAGIDGEERGTGMNLVRDVMTARPVTVTSATSISEARRLLQQHRIRHLPVLDPGDGRLIGIISDRDVMITDVELSQSLERMQSDLLHGLYRQVATVMKAPVIVVDMEAAVYEAAALLVDHRVGALPVVHGDRLVGIISTADVLRGVIGAARIEASGNDFPPMVPMPLFGDVRPGRPEPRP